MLLVGNLGDKEKRASDFPVAGSPFSKLYLRRKAFDTATQFRHQL
jgi:hypothetical protein